MVIPFIFSLYGTPVLCVPDHDSTNDVEVVSEVPAPEEPPPQPLTDKIYDPETEINKIPLEYVDQVFGPREILDDKLNLLPDDFKITTGLKKRVSFWLDIYTKYSSHFVILHDAREPWIIYRVVDLRPIYDQHGNRFVKDINDRKTVSQARHDVRRTLISLARKKSYTNLTPKEYEIYRILESQPGSRKKVFLSAARNMRSQRGQKDFFRSGLVASSPYLSQMEDIFAQYDLPTELTRLPLVESSFNVDAKSKVGAGGVWQFMEGMGRKYLKVNRVFDERISPIKATEAAAKLMLENFKILKSWPLAVTAYNHGAGGVEKACKRLKSRDVSDLVDNYHSRSFSFASQNFYSEFLAALYGEKYQDKIFGFVPKYQPLAAEDMELNRRVRARALAQTLGMTLSELKLYNPDLKNRAIAGASFIPAGYRIRIPPEKKDLLKSWSRTKI